MARLGQRFAGFALAAFAAFAAGAQAPPPASPVTPQRTSASYEDWTLRCEIQGTPAQKACEIAQSATAQGQPAPLSQIAIGRPVKSEPMKIIFQVPVNVWLPTGTKLVYDEKEPGLAATFKRCMPTGCFAEADLKEDLAKKLRARTVNGRLEFKDAVQRDVAIPVSFKGFGQAFDALSKEQ
jgi:invasion protein IalB